LKVREVPSRESYIQTQIDRSNVKFHFCKVSIDDVEKYARLIAPRQSQPGPIACLGTRNGREVDLFRVGFFGSAARRATTSFFERQTHSFRSAFPPVEALGRSRAQELGAKSVIGVEINPRAARSDIHVGSFDEMPAEWSGKFGVVFSNSFDQSQDPYRTAAEWKRILRPGGFLIFCFAEEDEPTVTDPVGAIRLKDVMDLFGGRLVYFADKGSKNGYTEAILQRVEE
jgi:hypothetical protein